jgi:hypothetical protein
MLPSTVSPPHMSNCSCLVAPTIPTSLPWAIINWHPHPPDVFSSDTPLVTKVSGVLISPPTISLSFDMLFFDEADFPFSASPRLTNDLDIFLQDDSTRAAPMPAPLSTPHDPRHPGFQLWTTSISQTVSSGGETTLSSQITWPSIAPSLLALLTLASPHASPMTPTAPCVALTSTTPVVSHAAPSNLSVPHATSVSLFYSQQYSRYPQAAREPLAPPLHQHSLSVKAVPVSPLFNPYLMRITLSATSVSVLSPVPTSIHATLIDLN